jgi:hypothetical protein
VFDQWLETKKEVTAAVQREFENTPLVTFYEEDNV